MPLMGSLYVGNSGLQSSQNALNSTAHNMTNTDTVGYVRQQVQLNDREYNTLKIDASTVSNSQIGLGAYYSQVRQIRDVFLDQTYREESGRLGFYGTTYSAMEEVEVLLGELDGASFQNSIKDLWVAVQELAKDPGSSVTQGLLVQRSYAFLSDAQSVYDGLCSYQDDLNLEIKSTVDKINDYGNQIWELNEQIRKIETGGIEKANDLKDTRNRLLDELSGMASISYNTDIDGNVLVKIEGHDFVSPARVLELGVQSTEATGFYEVFWKDDASYELNNEGRKIYNTEGAKVFDFSLPISTDLDTDIGSLKAMILARGDHRGNYTDLTDGVDADGNRVTAEQKYANISDSVMMTIQAEFDKMISSVAKAVNQVLTDAYASGTGKYMSDGNGGAIQMFHRTTADTSVAEDVTRSETLFSVSNMFINQELMQQPSKLGFKKEDGSIDYKSAEKLKAAFADKNYALNPSQTNKLCVNDFYSSLVAQVANDGSVYKSIRDNEQITVDSTEAARQQIIGVSTDEELSNMIRFQNSYNASSRYINVISEMLEHLLATLGV